MGVWGQGIRQDDVVCDVVSDIEEHLKQGKSISDATKAVCKQFADAIRDCDEGPLIWIGLADAQWTYGQLDPGVLQLGPPRRADYLSAGMGHREQ